MSSTACLLSKSDVDWWGRAASRPRLRKRFPNACLLSSPDPLRGGAKYTAPAGGNENGFRTPVPLSLQIHWLGGGGRKDTVPAGGDENGFRPPVSSPQPRGDMEPCPQPCPSPLQFKCLKGGGSFPPPPATLETVSDVSARGGALPPSPIHGHGLLSIPPLAATLETVSDVSRGGGKLPPPLRHLNWGGDGHCWGHGSISPQGCEEEAGVWKPFSISRLWSIVIYPCAHRHWIWRRDGRSETVFVGSAKRHARRLSAAMPAFLNRGE